MNLAKLNQTLMRQLSDTALYANRFVDINTSTTGRVARLPATELRTLVPMITEDDWLNAIRDLVGMLPDHPTLSADGWHWRNDPAEELQDVLSSASLGDNAQGHEETRLTRFLSVATAPVIQRLTLPIAYSPDPTGVRGTFLMHGRLISRREPSELYMSHPLPSGGDFMLSAQEAITSFGCDFTSVDMNKPWNILLAGRGVSDGAVTSLCHSWMLSCDPRSLVRADDKVPNIVYESGDTHLGVPVVAVHNDALYVHRAFLLELFVIAGRLRNMARQLEMALPIEYYLNSPERPPIVPMRDTSADVADMIQVWNELVDVVRTFVDVMGPFATRFLACTWALTQPSRLIESASNRHLMATTWIPTIESNFFGATSRRLWSIVLTELGLDPDNTTVLEQPIANTVFKRDDGLRMALESILVNHNGTLRVEVAPWAMSNTLYTRIIDVVERHPSCVARDDDAIELLTTYQSYVAACNHLERSNHDS